MCSAPDVPPPPARRQTQKDPERKEFSDGDPRNRRRGYASLISRAPSLQPATTTASLGG